MRAPRLVMLGQDHWASGYPARWPGLRYIWVHHTVSAKSGLDLTQSGATRVAVHGIHDCFDTGDGQFPKRSLDE